MDSDALYKTWRKYSSVLFSTFVWEKTKELTENVTVVVLSTARERHHVVHVQCWAMFLGGQANLCWKQKAMPSAVRFNRHVQQGAGTQFTVTSAPKLYVCQKLYLTLWFTKWFPVLQQLQQKEICPLLTVSRSWIRTLSPSTTAWRSSVVSGYGYTWQR